MKMVRRAAAFVCASVALSLASLNAAGAQTGRTIGEPEATPDSASLQLVPTLIFGGILLSIALAMVLSRRPKREPKAEVHEATEDELREAKAAILETRTTEALCAEAAHHAVKLGHAEGAVVMVDDREGRAGKPVSVHETLITRILREHRLIKLKQVRAVPVIDGADVVGLVAYTGGDSETLSAISRFVADAYTAGHRKRNGLAEDRSLGKSTSNVDSLTGIGDRRRFDRDLAAVADNTEQIPVSLAMFDIDNFQFYNDAHGKQAGNEVLRSIAELIAGNLRESDVVYRYSGVKFVALLPGADVENALVVVNRIRKGVESTRFVGEEVQPLGRVTISVGVAEAPSDNTATLVDAADQALEQAKASGRNAVMIEGDIQ